jgi:hypothetical protein
MECGIIEGRDSEDTVDHPCDRDAVAICIDCGMPVCDGHAEDCTLCNETFCATCLAFHNRELHHQKSAAVDDRRRRRRSV